MLEGCCYTDSISMLQRYKKKLRKQNFLIKKNPPKGEEKPLGR